MMHTVYLHGHLKKKFGDKYNFDVTTAGEAIRALHCAFPKRFIEQLKRGHYRVVRGDAVAGMSIGLVHINDFRLGNAELHIIPVAGGSKGGSTKGTVEIIAGVALIGAAIFFSGGTLAAPLIGAEAAGGGILGGLVGGITYGNIAVLGLGVALMGVSTVLAKAPPTNDNTSSFSFSGPINVNKQGVAVPLIFGEVICGSQAISAGFDIENIGLYQPLPIGP